MPSYQMSSLSKGSSKGRMIGNNQLEDRKMIVIPSQKSSPPRKSKLRLRHHKESTILTEEEYADNIVDKKTIRA